MKIYFCMFIIALSVVSCSEKEKPEIVVSKLPFWKLVQGTYRVTDEVNNEEFEIKVSIKTDTIWLNNSQYINNDSIFLYNFNNSFDSVYSKYFTCVAPTDRNCIVYTAPHGIKDKIGKRWLIEDWDDPNTQEIENIWINGKITFSFSMNNMAYWIQDSVPYQDLYIKQKAVKID